MKARTIIFSLSALATLLLTAEVTPAKPTAFALVSPASESQATNPPYLKEFPPVERVKAEIKGSDPVDTSARQIGALWQLQQMVKTLAGPRFQSNEFTPDESRLIGSYFNAWQQFQYKDNSPPPPDQPRWRKLREVYEQDPGVREELLQKFFSKEFRSAFLAGSLANPAPQAATAVLSTASGFASEPGAANPLAGAHLLLMKESFGDYMNRNRMLQGPPGSSGNISPLAIWADSCRRGLSLCKDTMLEAQSIFIHGAKMDAGGKTTFPAVPPGSYYVLGQGVANKQHLVWDVKVDLRPGANSLILDQRNFTPLDAKQTRAKASEPGRIKRAAEAPAAPPRPSGPTTCTLRMTAINDSRGAIGRTTFYLLDDDFENILKRAGFEQQMIFGKTLPLLNSFELVSRWKSLKDNNPLFSVFEGMSGESFFDFDLDGEYALGMKALADHTVATIKTDINGKASFPSLPAGTYYIYGSASDFVKTGERGTLSGNTVTLRDTGYDKATIWNLKVTVKPGQNSITLTPDNAAFAGN